MCFPHSDLPVCELQSKFLLLNEGHIGDYVDGGGGVL